MSQIKIVPTMHQWQVARDTFNSRGCTHWGSVRIIIEAFLAAAPAPQERRVAKRRGKTENFVCQRRYGSDDRRAAPIAGDEKK